MIPVVLCLALVPVHIKLIVNLFLSHSTKNDLPMAGVWLIFIVDKRLMHY